MLYYKFKEHWTLNNAYSSTFVCIPVKVIAFAPPQLKYLLETNLAAWIWGFDYHITNSTKTLRDWSLSRSVTVLALQYLLLAWQVAVLLVQCRKGRSSVRRKYKHFCSVTIKTHFAVVRVPCLKMQRKQWTQNILLWNQCIAMYLHFCVSYSRKGPTESLEFESSGLIYRIGSPT